MESIKKNILYQTIYQFLIILIPLITTPYVARVLGANGVGIYSLTYSITSYFVLFAKLGIQVYGNRAIATVRDNQDKLNKVFSELLTIHIVISVLVIGIYGIYICFFLENYNIYSTIQIFYLMAELFNVSWLFGGLEKIKLTIVRNCIIKVLTLCAIFLFVKSKSDVLIYCAILSFSAVVSEGIMWKFVPQYVKFVRPTWKNSCKHFLPLITFFIPSIAVSLYKIMDKIMLGTLSDTVQLGYYESCEKIVSIILVIAIALETVMLPKMSNIIAKGEHEKSKKIIEESINYIMAISIAAFFGIIGVASNFIEVFLGIEYLSCENILIGLALSTLFTAFANVLRTQFLIPNYREKIYLISVLCGGAINVVMNFIFIPQMNAFGAVIGTITAESIVCFIQTIYSKKELPIMKYLCNMCPYILAGFIMSTGVNYIGRIMGKGIFVLCIQIVCGMLIYGVLVGGLKYCNRVNELKRK